MQAYAVAAGEERRHRCASAVRSYGGRDRTARAIRLYAYQRARLFPGGSLKVVAGKAPRNFRRHTARILLVDEVDAIEASAEGDPVDSGLP